MTLTITAELRRLVATCAGGLAGQRDRALLLLGFAAALHPNALPKVPARRVALAGLAAVAVERLRPRPGEAGGRLPGGQARPVAIKRERLLEPQRRDPSAPPTRDDVQAPAHPDWLWHRLTVSGDIDSSGPFSTRWRSGRDTTGR